VKLAERQLSTLLAYCTFPSNYYKVYEQLAPMKRSRGTNNFDAKRFSMPSCVCRLGMKIFKVSTVKVCANLCTTKESQGVIKSVWYTGKHFTRKRTLFQAVPDMCLKTYELDCRNLCIH
jgi:hypothetical protein